MPRFNGGNTATTTTTTNGEFSGSPSKNHRSHRISSVQKLIPTFKEKMNRGRSIEKIRQYPLGDDDLRRVLGDDIAIHNYPDLERMTSADQLFDARGRAILLFPNASPTVGHWTALLRRPEGIEFFDPYGEPPEAAKGGMSRARLESLDIESPHLTRLLRASGRPVFYNTYPFQKDRADVATCGRHAAVRLLYAPMSLDEYAATLDASGYAPDDFVSGVTYDKIKK